MLLRIADHLYWMGRYIERAENILQAVEWTYYASLLERELAADELEGLLTLIGQRDDFLARSGPAASGKILRFMIFDPDNPSSIHSSLRSARENGRVTWGTISPEAWESLNSLWLDLSEISQRRQTPSETGTLLTRMREGVHLFRGAVQSALFQDEASRWIGLGTFLERADHIIRVFIAKHESLLNEDKERDSYHASMGVLRWAGAVGAYRREYHDAFFPRKVIELLILRDDIPRSLHACLDQINECLEPRRGVGEMAARVASDLHFTLHRNRTHELSPGDLTERWAGFAESICAIASEIDVWFREPQCG
jgi:uncharacterized alpha-E superfamily protein